MYTNQSVDIILLPNSSHTFNHFILGHSGNVGSVGLYGPVMTDSSRLQQHHTTSDDPGQGCKAHEGGI